MKCDLCGKDIGTDTTYNKLNLTLEPHYIPIPTLKYRVAGHQMYGEPSFFQRDTHTIEDANICKRCSIEVIQYIKSLGKELNNNKGEEN